MEYPEYRTRNAATAILSGSCQETTMKMSQFVMCLLVLGVCLAGCGSKPDSVESPATPQQARRLLEEAIEFYKANGKDKAFAEIENPNGKFRRGELYIFVYGRDGLIAAHGADLKRVGSNVMTLQDKNGKFFGKEIMQIGEAGGTVDYAWVNPVTGEIQQKTSFIALADGFRFGCGTYQ